MSTTPSELGSANNSSSGGFNLSPDGPQVDPMTDFTHLKNWAPQAMQALRKSNLKSQIINPPEQTPQGSGIAKGLIGGLLT